MSHSIRLCDTLGAIVTEDGTTRIVTNNGATLGVMSEEDVVRFREGYGDYRWRTARLNESSLASMVQQLAGDGPVELGSIIRTPTGYVMRIRMKRWPSVQWRIHNWGEWYQAQEDAQLETLKRS